MIENFNGVFFLILYILVLIGNIYYAYSTLFNTKKWLDQYNTHHSALVITRVLGSIISGFSLVGIYILFNGVGGTWPYFAGLFLGFCIMSIAGIYSVEIDWPKNYLNKEGFENVKVSKEAYIPAIIFSIFLGIIMYGLSDKIYN
jgi:hypothetical protein